MLGATYGGKETGARYGGTETGALYGGADSLPQGWRVALFEPKRTGPTRQLTDALLSVDFGFEHTALSDVRVQIPPFEGLTADRFLNGRLHIYYDGWLLFRAKIDTHEEADDHTLTIGGFGESGNRLQGGEIEQRFGDILTHEAVEQVFDAEGFISRVHVPLSERVHERIVQEARSESGFREINTFRPRDSETGQFTSGTQSDFAPTKPLTITQQGLTQLQTNIVIEGERWNDSSGTTTTNQTDLASGGEEEILNGTDDQLRYRFDFGYTIPTGQFRVGLRLRRVSGQTASSVLVLRLDGELIGRIDTSRIETGYEWVFVDVSNKLEPAGEGDDHELTIDVSDGDPDVSLDVLSLHDDRFSYFFDNNTANSGALAGPELYPDAQEIRFDAPTLGIDISDGRVSATWNHPSNEQAVGVVLPTTGRERFSHGAGTTAHQCIHTTATTTQIRGAARIGRYDDPQRTETPLNGSETQILEEYTLTVSGDEISIVDSRQMSGTPLSIIQELCDYADLRFVVQPPSQDPTAPPRVEVFETADSRLRRPLPAQAIITSVSESVEGGEYANVVEVEGAEIPGRPAQNYRGTARAEQEIEALADPPVDDGIRKIKLIDRSLTTDNDCRSKARTELHSRLASDDVGGSVSVTPALIRPGYPYETPFFAEGEDDAGTVGYGLNYGFDYGLGVDPDMFSSLETSSFGESAGDAATGLAFERVTGFVGLLTGKFTDQPALAD